ncbi:MAG: hypothetical protein U7123_07800 [Potamolinea sp.]
MRVSTVAIYTFAALATQEFSHGSNATSSVTLPTPEPESNNFLAENKITTPEPTKAKDATEYHRAIAPPETFDTQPFVTQTVAVDNRQNSPVRPDIVVTSEPPKYALPVGDTIAEARPIPSPTTLPEVPSATAQSPATPSRESPLQNRQPVLSTADQLRQGEVITNLRYRQSFPSGKASDIGLTGQPTFGASWGSH